MRKQVFGESMKEGLRNNDEEREMRKKMRERVAWCIKVEIEKGLRRNLLD